MKDLIKKVQEDVLTEDDRFESEVKLYMSMSGDSELEYTPKVRLQFKIEVEYRTWGIKGIYLHLDKPVKISYNIEGQDEQKEVEIDFRKLEDERKLSINWAQGSGWSVYELSVYLDESGAVKTVDADAVYAVPDGA